MISYRVRREDTSVVEFHGQYIIGRAGKRVRVYEDDSGYSSTSGGFIKKGKAMRDADDKIISFDNTEQAKSWIDKGCVVYPTLLY